MKLPWQVVEPLAPPLFAEVRHKAIFECCKWDPQVEDVSALSPMPLVLLEDAWRELVALAEQLAQETMAAEQAVLARPQLLKKLGLSWRLRRRLANPEVTSGHSRHLHLIRFDFHFTTEGWRISEANSDVPGGFVEASGFTQLMARHYPNARISGDPAARLVQAISDTVGKSGTVALAHATAFSDDRQVMVFLGQRLQQAGLVPIFAAPDHLRWENRQASLASDWSQAPVDFVFRFFPAEWLPALPSRCQWWQLLGGAETPLCNPGSAIITQSKRFPLVWPELPERLPAWERLLPKTYEVRELSEGQLSSESLVFKPAFGRVGDMILMPGLTPEKQTREIQRSVRRYPKYWIAQERFEAVPLATPWGNVFPGVGIYTLAGKVIGVYGRIACRPLIDHLAQDTAVLVAEPVCPAPGKANTNDEAIRTLQTVGA